MILVATIVSPQSPKLAMTASCSCRLEPSQAQRESRRWSWWCRAALGVAPSHLKRAETVVSDGFAAFVLDSFGGRDVTRAAANQTQAPLRQRL